MIRPPQYHVFIRWIKGQHTFIDGDPNVLTDKAIIPAAVERATQEAEDRIRQRASWGAEHYKIIVATVTEEEIVERKKL